MVVSLTGASGFIGRCLVDRLLSEGHSVQAFARRNPRLDSRASFVTWDAARELPAAEPLSRADAVVHLAGEPVSQRWTPEVKARIRSSRVEGTARLIEALSGLKFRPRTLVSASAIGYYGSRGDEVLNEQSRPGTGFLPEVCLEWEKTAQRAETLGMRVVLLRIGVVLGPGGGALKKMLPPFRLGLGGPLGSGRQWMSWIHLEDVVGLILHALGNEDLRGAVNVVAPEPVTNARFAQALGKAVGRPAIVPVPSFAIRALFGDMAEIVLASQRVVPKAALESGYRYRYGSLDAALRSAV